MEPENQKADDKRHRKPEGEVNGNMRKKEDNHSMKCQMQKRTWPGEWGWLIAAFIGIGAFLLIYGMTPLDVTNDAWIMAGYDETDIIQHYSGWLAFRNSDWTFPLGIASDMAVGQGTCISYTDSIPWVAIVCKLFRSILPETFQYFGWYALLCYVLQGIAAWKILQRKSNNVLYSSVGSVLFVFAPILMERSLRHTALGSQWLILFAILVWLNHREVPKKRHYLEYLALLVLAIGIHPYFLPMIAVFLVLSVMGDLGRKRYGSLLLAIADLAVIYVVGCVLGVLGSGVQTSRDGYGYYSMNLNAIYNPTSIGNYTWSSLIKIHPQTLGNYDGFNYLGAGVFAGVLIFLVLEIVFRSACRDGIAAGWLRRNALLLIFLVLCTMFAVSNVVTLNDREVLTIHLPEKILNLCGIFRASSRIFYPVYYCIMIGVFYGIWHYRKRIGIGSAVAFACLVMFLQLFDLHTCIREKHDRIQGNAEYVSILQEPEMNAVMEDRDVFLLDQYYDGVRMLSIPALKHHMKLYFSTANSGSYEKTGEEAQRILSVIKDTGEIGNNLVLTSDWDIAQQYLQYENIACYERDGAYFLFQK